MGILDEAIRDHLALKRRSGAQEDDLKRLEDEAFGPPSRPGDPGTDTGAPIEPAVLPPDGRPEAPAEPAPVTPSGKEPQGEAAAPPTPEPQASPPSPEPGLFHDFAAEEGLVAPSAEPPVEPTVEGEGEVEREPAEAPSPAREASLDDTQPHDMAAELEQSPQAEQQPGDALEIGEEDLELQLDDEELGASSALEEPVAPPTEADEGAGGFEIVEEDEVELVEEEVELTAAPEDAEDAEDSGEDLLEETPDFLRETPEHDRLWFEQRPPKDFDFDDD